MSGNSQDKNKILRASMLSNYADCGLRAAVQQWPHLFKEYGYEPKILQEHIGARCGTSFHAGVAYLFENSSDSPKYEAALDKAVSVFDEVKDVRFDEVTGSRKIAIGQINNMIRVYFHRQGYKMRPEKVEQKVTAKISKIAQGWALTGTPDVLTRSGALKQRSLFDNKSGKISRIHIHQIGTYVALEETAADPIDHAATIFVPRAPLNKPISDVVVTPYNPAYAKRAALFQASRIAKDFEVFQTIKDPLAFPINPTSMLCGEAYCNAYGTPLCGAWKIKEAKK